MCVLLPSPQTSEVCTAAWGFLASDASPPGPVPAHGVGAAAARGAAATGGGGDDARLVFHASSHANHDAANAGIPYTTDG